MQAKINGCPPEQLATRHSSSCCAPAGAKLHRPIDCCQLQGSAPACTPKIRITMKDPQCYFATVGTLLARSCCFDTPDHRKPEPNSANHTEDQHLSRCGVWPLPCVAAVSLHPRPGLQGCDYLLGLSTPKVWTPIEATVENQKKHVATGLLDA